MTITLTKPHISEKSMGSSAFQVYTFKVGAEATKNQIKEAVEKIFKVHVVRVRTQKMSSRRVRSARTGKYLTKKGFKKALVVLAPKELSLIHI